MKLGTRDIELSTPRAAGAVKTNMLGPQEIITVTQALGYRDLDALGSFLCRQYPSAQIHVCGER